MEILLGMLWHTVHSRLDVLLYQGRAEGNFYGPVVVCFPSPGITLGILTP